MWRSDPPWARVGEILDFQCLISDRIRSEGEGGAASPDPPDLIGVDEFVHGDDSQAKALGLANQHAIEGVSMMLWEFLEEAAVVDGGREQWHTDALQLVWVKLVPVVGDFEVKSLAGEFDGDFPKAGRRVIERKFSVDGLGGRL